MHPILFSIGDIHLYTYGLFIAIGFITAIFVSQKLAAPHGFKPQEISDLYYIILVSALIGSRGLYIIINFSEYRNNFFDIFKIWNGGLVFFGGFIFSVAVLTFYLKYKKANLWLVADILAPGVALGHAIGRIGCLFAGCCYGQTCDLPWAITFTHPLSLAPLNIALHPTQAYMFLSNLALFFILLVITRIKRFTGMVFLTYLMLYSVSRFINEMFRADFRGNFIFDFISLSQGIGLIVAVASLIILIILSKRSNENR